MDIMWDECSYKHTQWQKSGGKDKVNNGSGTENLNWLENKSKLTPASAATGFPRRLSSVSISFIVLLIRDWMPGILDLITVSKCWYKNQWL